MFDAETTDKVKDDVDAVLEHECVFTDVLHGEGRRGRGMVFDL